MFSGITPVLYLGSQSEKKVMFVGLNNHYKMSPSAEFSC